MGTRLYIGNLSFNTSEDAVRSLFAQQGEVTECNLITDKFSGRSRGFAFVVMGTQEAANQAIEKVNGQELDGRKLTVNEARPREERQPRGDRGPRMGGGGGRDRDRMGGGRGPRRDM
jgi:RNA recognition motif-containing protein